MPTYSKHSRKPRVVSRGSKVKQTKDSQMSMNRKVTRDVYEAREIAEAGPSREEGIALNKQSIDEFQSTLKPIRSSQKR